MNEAVFHGLLAVPMAMAGVAGLNAVVTPPPNPPPLLQAMLLTGGFMSVAALCLALAFAAVALGCWRGWL